MNIKQGLKNLFELSSEPLNYISAVIGIGSFIGWILTEIKKNQDKPFLISIFLLIFLSLSILFIINIKNIIYYLFYLKDRKKIIQKNNTKHQQIVVDYEKILPSTQTLEHIKNNIQSKAKKWSSDAVLSKCFLFVWDKEKTSIDLHLQFFSSIKQIELEISIDGLNLSKVEFEKKAKLSIRKTAYEIKPFYLDKLWRKVVITSLQASQSMISSNYYSAGISGNYPIGMRVYVSPDTEINQSKVFTYSFNDKKVIESDYPTERVVIDFLRKNE